jgi:hypothetical protein
MAEVQEPTQTQEISTETQVPETTAEASREPTIIFLFDLKNWYEKIQPLSKLDLIDIAPLVSTQFYIDFSIQAYVLILTKGKWDALDPNLKRKFMFISSTIKQMMEGPMNSIQKETYENSDIFEMLMSQQPQPILPDTNTNIDLETIKEGDEEIIVPEL